MLKVSKSIFDKGYEVNPTSNIYEKTIQFIMKIQLMLIL